MRSSVYNDEFSKKILYKFWEFSRGLTRSWQDGLIHRICAKMYESSGDLQKEFQRFDTNSDGRLTYDEFVEALQSQNLGMKFHQRDVRISKVFCTIAKMLGSRQNSVKSSENSQKIRRKFAENSRKIDGKIRSEQRSTVRPHADDRHWSVRKYRYLRIFGQISSHF